LSPKTHNLTEASTQSKNGVIGNGVFGVFGVNINEGIYQLVETGMNEDQTSNTTEWKLVGRGLKYISLGYRTWGVNSADEISSGMGTRFSG